MLSCPAKLNGASHSQLEGTVFLAVFFLANSKVGRKGDPFYFLFNQLC